MQKKLFKDHILFKELHPTENNEINFSRIFDTSSKDVIWQCTKDSRHTFKQKIRSRTKEGYGCSYCSKSKTLPSESLAAIYPEITAELHPLKNPDFDPKTRSPTSNKVVVWLCSKGHEWKCRVEHRTRRKDAGCPTCRKQKSSFAYKHTQLLEEWHPTKNKHLNPWKLSSSSHEKVWWQCLTNLEHDDWQRIVATRTHNDKGCPKCSIKNRPKNKKNISLPLLSEYSKKLSSQWHPTKNLEKLPSDYTAGSDIKAWWLCPTCQNEWSSSIRNRARQNKGCPACAHNKRGNRGRKSKKFIGKSIMETHPKLVEQWHKILNKDLLPKNFTYGSAQEIWWQCLSNDEHYWKEKITFRTHRESIECRICTKEKNSLFAVSPEISAEWHPTKNGDLKPSDFSRASGEIVWWQCSVNPEHEWKSDIRNRTVNKSKCRQCAKEKIGIHFSNPDIDVDSKDVNTHHIFTTNIDSLTLLLDYSFHDNKRLIAPVYRMIYSSVITALESYLSDAFQNKIINNSERIVKIIKASSELQKRKYSVEEIIEWHDNVESKVIAFLADIIWHNLYKVKTLYEDVLEITFPSNTKKINKAIGIRHDLVHRNGGIKGGGVHKITKPDVEKLISDTEIFVDNIQKQLIKID